MRALELFSGWFKAPGILAVRLDAGPPSLLLTPHPPPPNPNCPPPPHPHFLFSLSSQRAFQRRGAGGGVSHMCVRGRGTKWRWQTSHTWIFSVKPTAADTNCLEFPARYIRPSWRHTAGWLAANPRTERKLASLGLDCAAVQVPENSCVESCVIALLCFIAKVLVQLGWQIKIVLHTLFCGWEKVVFTN